MEHYKNLSLKAIVEHVKGIGLVEELWKEIKGYEGYYVISNFGRVKSHSRMVYRERFGDYVKRVERILKQKIHRDGYLCVTLQVDKKRAMRQVHILVCDAYIPRVTGKTQVNHRFGNKKDNRASKLEWMSPKENTHHAINLGLSSSQIGESNNKSKLTEKDVLYIRDQVKDGRYGVRKRLADEYGVNVTAIYKIIKREHWKHI